MGKISIKTGRLYVEGRVAVEMGTGVGVGHGARHQRQPEAVAGRRQNPLNIDQLPIRQPKY